jgi:hypothetical protein
MTRPEVDGAALPLHPGPGGGTEAALNGRDGLVAAVLFAGTLAYLYAWPRNLGFADESYFLYEAKRIRDGEVLYRDVFQYVTPGAPYVMALLFRLFGTSIETARIATAFLHGLTVAILYVAGRRLQVRRPLAAVVGLAYLALCYPSWPVASWHWFSTALLALLLLALVATDWAARPRRCVVSGVITGLMIGVQQQRAMPVAAGVVLLFCVDHVLARWRGCGERARSLARRLAWYAGGAAAVLVPGFLFFLVLAGFESLYAALVRFPLENYRESFRTHWGSVTSVKHAAYTVPAVLKALLFVWLVPLLRAGGGLVRGMSSSRTRRATTLGVFSAASVLSIWYYPDFIHVAFIGAVLLVCLAESVEWGLRLISQPPWLGRAGGWVVAVSLASALALHLGRNLTRARGEFPIAHDTAFGRVDFSSRWEPLVIDAARALLAQDPTRELFCYPNLASPYLTTGGRNPTPFQHFFARVFPDQHIAQVLETLRARRVPYIIAAYIHLRRGDPIADLIAEEYELVDIPALAMTGEVPLMLLYKRKDKGIGAPALPGAEDGP